MDKYLKWIFLPGVAICAALRIYLKLAVIDPTTGFYEGSKILPTIFTILLGIGIIAVLVLGMRKKPAPFRLRYLPFTRICVLVAGVLCFPLGIVSTMSQLERLQNLNSGQPLPLLILSLLAAIIGLICLSIAPFGTGILFLWIAARTRNASEEFKFNGILLLLPVFWQAANLLSLFMEYTAIRTVSDEKLVILMLIVCAPFFLAHARILGNVNSERGMQQLVGFGLAFAFLAIPLSLGFITAALTGRVFEEGLGLMSALFYLFAGGYAASLCLTTQR